jgi:hypothetical protein
VHLAQSRPLEEKGSTREEKQRKQKTAWHTVPVLWLGGSAKPVEEEKGSSRGVGSHTRLSRGCAGVGSFGKTEAALAGTRAIGRRGRSTPGSGVQTRRQVKQKQSIGASSRARHLVLILK